MRQIPALTLLLMLFQLSRAQVILPRTNLLVVGEQQLFHSAVLDEDRILNVYLPTGYSPDSSYEVIYLLDGTLDEDFMHISGLTQFLSYSWIADMPPCIVVGIANTDRKRDFTFFPNDKRLLEEFPTAGGSANFIRFLKEEVIPLTHKWYKLKGKGCIIGQSLGGLLATEILFTEPELFDGYLIVSPSLWWDSEALLGENVPELNANTHVFVAVGKEGPQMVKPAKAFYKSLRKTGAHTGFQYFPECDHGDALHPAAEAGFKFLYKD